MGGALQVHAEDPTLAGEVAAKKALLLTLDGQYVDEASDFWIRQSYTQLSEPTAAMLRERVATTIIEQRITSLRGKKQGVSEEKLTAMRHARTSAEETLVQQHSSHSGRWDRYATMLDARSAILEGAYGNPTTAASLACRGIWRAIKADPEHDSAEGHRAFKIKHLQINASAFTLAAARKARLTRLQQKLQSRLIQ